MRLSRVLTSNQLRVQAREFVFTPRMSWGTSRMENECIGPIGRSESVVQEIVHALLRLGKDASYVELAMDFGHDSFLVHSPKLYALIQSFIDR